MLRLKTRPVLETPTTGLSRQLSKTRLEQEGLESAQNDENADPNGDDGLGVDDPVLGDASLNRHNQNQQRNNVSSQQHHHQQQQQRLGGLASIHGGYQPRFLPSSQQQNNNGTQPQQQFSSQDFDVADYCTPADQQFELAGNGVFQYGNNPSSSQQMQTTTSQSFLDSNGKENAMPRNAAKQQPPAQKQFGVRSPAALSPMRHKRARLGCITDSPNLNATREGGGGFVGGFSGSRFLTLSSQQMTPRESSQPLLQPLASGVLPQNSRGSAQALQFSQGNNNRISNNNNNTFEVPPIPNRERKNQREQILLSPPISRNAFLCDEEQSTELPAHRIRRRDENGFTNNTSTRDGWMLRFRSDFADLGLIAKGVFGRVSKVVHRLDGKMYAIKRTEKKLYGDSEIDNALREVHAMTALSSLNSANIVRYYTSWMEYDHLYIQMELCENGALKVGPDEKFTKNEKDTIFTVLSGPTKWTVTGISI